MNVSENLDIESKFLLNSLVRSLPFDGFILSRILFLLNVSLCNFGERKYTYLFSILYIIETHPQTAEFRDHPFIHLVESPIFLSQGLLGFSSYIASSTVTWLLMLITEKKINWLLFFRLFLISISSSWKLIKVKYVSFVINSTYWLHRHINWPVWNMFLISSLAFSWDSIS